MGGYSNQEIPEELVIGECYTGNEIQAFQNNNMVNAVIFTHRQLYSMVPYRVLDGEVKSYKIRDSYYMNLYFPKKNSDTTPGNYKVYIVE